MKREEIQALIDAAPDGRIGFHQAGRPCVTVPYGHHVLDGPIVVDRRLDVSFSGAVLIAPNGVRALDIKPAAWGCRVRDVTVFGQSQDGAKHAEAGVHVAAFGVALDDVLVRFCGTGIAVYGSAAAQSNANGARVTNCAAFNCDVGLHLRGGDTNGGRFAGVLVDSCRVGVLDESFLGNTFDGLMLHTISEHAYRCTVAANYSTIVGTYLELDCGSVLPGGVGDTIVDQQGQTWIGGAAVPYARTATRLGYNASRVRFGEWGAGGVWYSVRVPDAAAEAAVTAQRFTAAGALIDGVRMRWNQLLRRFGVEYFAPPGGNGSTMPLAMTAVGHSSGHGQARANASPSAAQGYDIPKPTVL